MSVTRKVRMVVPAIVLVLASVSVSAQAMGPRNDRGPDYGGYVSQSLRHLLSQVGNRRLSALTGAEIRQALDNLSVARQKQAYVRRAETASLFIPGAGQFIAKAPAAGALFLAGDLAVAAGSLVGAYFLLPSDLQFSQENYLTDSFTNIRDKWMAHNFLDYLKPAAVLAGGMILGHLLRHFAAESAGEMARQNIQDKKVTFRPEPFLLVPGAGGPAIGFGWRMRF